jgi:PEP-CTERM motif
MAKSTYLALGALFLGVGYTSSASATTIFINSSLTNPSFEASNNPTGVPPGWTVGGSPGAGAYTVTTAQYTPGSDGLSGGLIVPNGTNAADVPSAVSGSGSLQQTTNIPFTVGNTYVFDFWVGLPKTEPNGTTSVVGFPNSVTVAWLTGTTTDNLSGLGTATLSPLTGSGSTQTKGPNDSGPANFSIPSPGLGQWQEWRLTYTDVFTISTGPVGVQLAVLAATNNQGANFDIATGVPEPATWGMMLLGFAGLGFAFRQSRRKISFA